MFELRLTNAAAKDLANIRRYSERQHGSATANSYLRGFTKAFARLREHPRTGSERPGLPEGVRGLSCGLHVILYRATDTSVLIARVVHQSQDSPSAESFDLQ